MIKPKGTNCNMVGVFCFAHLQKNRPDDFRTGCAGRHIRLVEETDLTKLVFSIFCESLRWRVSQKPMDCECRQLTRWSGLSGGSTEGATLCAGQGRQPCPVKWRFATSYWVLPVAKAQQKAASLPLPLRGKS